MRIELTEASADGALHAGQHDELWVRVLSDELLDWPRVKLAMTPAQAELLGKYPNDLICAYYPGAEAAEEGFTFEDWFILKRRTVVS